MITRSTTCTSFARTLACSNPTNFKLHALRAREDTSHFCNRRVSEKICPPLPNARPKRTSQTHACPKRMSHIRMSQLSARPKRTSQAHAIWKVPHAIYGRCRMLWKPVLSIYLHSRYGGCRMLYGSFRMALAMKGVIIPCVEEYTSTHAMRTAS